jgi:phosphatidylglycerophosphate synthase
MSRHRLRARAIGTQVVALIGVAIIAPFVRASLEASRLYPAKALGAFALVALFVVRYIRSHHPFETFGLANQITTLRAALVAIVAAGIGEPPSTAMAQWAVLVALAATWLDGLDGWAARRTRMASRFGARFDVEMDAALIQVLAILVWQYGKAGPWVLMSGLLRYAFVAAGWLWPWMRRPLPVSLRGKFICIVQLAALMIALLPAIGPATSAWIAAVGLFALSYSFLVDTRWLWRQAALPRTQ